MFNNKTEKELKNEMKSNTKSNKKRKASLKDWLFLNLSEKFINRIPAVLSIIIVNIIWAAFCTLIVFVDKDTVDLSELIAESIFMFIVMSVVFSITIWLSFIMFFESKWINTRLYNFIMNYRKINESIKLNGKFYSIWYIIIFNINGKDNNDNLIIHKFSDSELIYNFIINTEKIINREKDRKHWTNLLETNRVLSFKEYRKIIKKEKKIKKLEKMGRDVKNFQAYHKLK